jgi:hypothetical protein
MIHYKDMVKGQSGRSLHHTASQTNKSSIETQPVKTSSIPEWTVQNCQLRPAERESMVSQVYLEIKYQSMDWARKSSTRPIISLLQNPGSIERWSIFDKRRILEIRRIREWRKVFEQRILRTGPREDIEDDFKNKAVIYRKRQLLLFRQQCACLFCQTSGSFSRELMVWW